MRDALTRSPQDRHRGGGGIPLPKGKRCPVHSCALPTCPSGTGSALVGEGWVFLVGYFVQPAVHQLIKRAWHSRGGQGAGTVSGSWGGGGLGLHSVSHLPSRMFVGWGQGGWLVRMQTPPPFPPRPGPPKVLEPAFLQFEILGETAGTTGAENFLRPFGGGKNFFTQCVYNQNAQIFVEKSKVSENHEKKN